MADERLGCGDARVFIHTRQSLASAVVEVPWTSIEWGRVLDETSPATIRAGAGCCGEIDANAVHTWSHQVAIFRFVDGDGPRVWSGPIVSMRDTAEEGLVIEARDLSAWPDHRRVHGDQFHSLAPLTEIFEAVWDDAMAPDPIEDYALQVTPSVATGDREILAEQHVMAGDVLRELGRTGLDWTVVDRIHYVSGDEVETTPLGPLIDEHFTEAPDIEEDGTQQANDWVVTGAGGGAEGDEVVGTATATPGPEGLLEAVASEPSIEDQGSADQAAQTRVDRSGQAPRFIREAALTPHAPVTIDQLIPGARVQVALTGRCLPVSAVQRLRAVKVTMNATDDGVVEQVRIELEPLGTTSP